MHAPYALTCALAVVVLAQAGFGLGVPGIYRDVAWIRATWFGNDAATLFLALPLIVVSLRLVARGSRRGYLLWLGLLGYGVYNYAFYPDFRSSSTAGPICASPRVVSPLVATRGAGRHLR
jgi:hypothetical protein